MAQNKDTFDGLHLQNSRYKYEFEETVTPIGGGSYGIVFKAKNQIDDKYYAIKKIQIFGINDFNKKIRELKIWAKLDCDYFVQYRSSWIEEYDSDMKKNFRRAQSIIEESTEMSEETESIFVPRYAILHIQMDLCLFTLKEVMMKINEELEIPKKEPLASTGYYIASELLIEILEGISFLHNQNPPIIHRDLKPQNILITKGSNGKFVRIGDFGISITHESEDQSHTQRKGTYKYMAPEVHEGKKYDTKADIYSIGVITQEIFNIDINNIKLDHIEEKDATLFEKYRGCINLINDSLKIKRSDRPDCDKMLNDRHLWAYSLKEISNYITNNKQTFDSGKVYNLDNEFVCYFLQSKLKILSRNDFS